MSRKILSIDIRSNGISAMLVENTLKGNLVHMQTHVPYPETGEDPEDRLTQIADTLNRVIADTNISGAESIVSISPEFISYRNLQVPFKDRKKIRQVLPFELEPTLAYAVDDVTVDFDIIHHETEKTDILVSVAKSDDINRIIVMLKDCGIAPYMITPGGFSSVLCLTRFSESDRDFLYIDIDGKYTTIFVVASGHVHVVRSFYSSVSDSQLKAKKLSGNILQVLAAFESLFVRDFEPSQIFLSGGDPDTDILLSEIESSVDVMTASIDMFTDLNEKLSISSDIPFNALLMNNALSLAAVEIIGMRTINFFGERSIVRKYWEDYKNDFIKTGLIAAFVFVLVMFNILFEAHFLQIESNQLTRQMAFIFQSTFSEESNITNPLKQMKDKVDKEKEKNVFTGEVENEVLNVDILNEISSRIPKDQDVEISNFVRGADSVIISGNTDSFNNVDDIKSRLEQSKLFKAITISSANLEKSSNRIQFKLKIDL